MHVQPFVRRFARARRERGAIEGPHSLVEEAVAEPTVEQHDILSVEVIMLLHRLGLEYHRLLLVLVLVLVLVCCRRRRLS